MAGSAGGVAARVDEKGFLRGAPDEGEVLPQRWLGQKIQTMPNGKPGWPKLKCGEEIIEAGVCVYCTPDDEDAPMEILLVDYMFDTERGADRKRLHGRWFWRQEHLDLSAADLALFAANEVFLTDKTDDVSVDAVEGCEH